MLDNGSGTGTGQWRHRESWENNQVQKSASAAEAETKEASGAFELLPELFYPLTHCHLQQEKGKGVIRTRDRSDELENMEVETGQVEYVSEQLDLSDAGLEAFSDVFARFQLPPEESSVRIANYIFLS